MDVRIFTFLVVSAQLKLTSSLTTSISGEISEDVTFLRKAFPVPPSTRAIIKVNVSFSDRLIMEERHLPIMGIYTTEDHKNIKKQCTYLKYGQLANKHLHLNIRSDEGRLLSPRCSSDRDGTTHCIGDITVQDFIPRNFSFSFGFWCDSIDANRSLKGLVYNISIYGQTNEIKCIWVPYNSVHECLKYYQHTALPNLIGGENIQAVFKDYEVFKAYVTFLKMISLCYQHLEELTCYILVPKCDTESRQVIHPCREMCHDFVKACSKVALPKNTFRTDKIPDIPIDDNNFIMVDTTRFDCDYLPSLNGGIPCHYKPVTCKSPPVVKNAVMSNASMNYE